MENEINRREARTERDIGEDNAEILASRRQRTQQKSELSQNKTAASVSAAQLRARMNGENGTGRHAVPAAMKPAEPVRNAHPDLPIIFITRPNTSGYIHSYEKSLDCARRRAVVHDTYLRALTAGDRNVYYIDGDSLYAGPLSDHCSADGCHPSDAGFIRMAERIGAYVSAVLR